MKLRALPASQHVPLLETGMLTFPVFYHLKVPKKGPANPAQVSYKPLKCPNCPLQRMQAMLCPWRGYKVDECRGFGAEPGQNPSMKHNTWGRFP